METFFNIFVFLLFTALWLAFVYALLANRSLLDSVWVKFRSWSVAVQLVVAVLFLPLVLGLWVWSTKWPGWLRILLIAGLAWFNIYTFFPRAL